MEIARLIAPLVSALIATLGLVATIPFGPLQRSSRQLRKLYETIEAMDEARHAAQRAVLLRKVDVLAGKVAALHKVPTPWSSYIKGAALASCGAQVVIDSFRNGVVEEQNFMLKYYPLALFITIGATLAMVVKVGDLTLCAHRRCRSERRRFIGLGFPDRFMPANSKDYEGLCTAIVRRFRRARRKRLTKRKLGQ